MFVIMVWESSIEWSWFHLILNIVISALTSGLFTVRSAYQLLQNSYPNYLQTDFKNSFKKMWALNLPSKLKILVWKVAWNYLPHSANLFMKKLRTNTICPRCGGSLENSDHVFRFCLTTQEVWKQLQMEWVLSNQDSTIWEWLPDPWNQEIKWARNPPT